VLCEAGPGVERAEGGAVDYVVADLRLFATVSRVFESQQQHRPGRAYVNFLHEMQPGKYSLAYDLQEPFWFLVDLTVITLIENEGNDER